MKNVLCTFSGKYGDILWSLATAKYISEVIVNGPVDFAVMPYYANLLPLLVAQDYIAHAYVIPDWLRTHSNHGDQPWEPPPHCKQIPWNTDEGGEYEQVWHLTYKAHPGISAPDMPLIHFIAYQQGISLPKPGGELLPYIDVDNVTEEEAAKIHFSSGRMTDVIMGNRLVTYCFNEQYSGPKEAFFGQVWREAQPLGLEFFNVEHVGWKESAWLIKHSLCFLGCRSANAVIATALNQRFITYEPHPMRHKQSRLGNVFGCPQSKETALPFALPIAVQANMCVDIMRKWREEIHTPVFLTEEVSREEVEKKYPSKEVQA